GCCATRWTDRRRAPPARGVRRFAPPPSRSPPMPSTRRRAMFPIFLATLLAGLAGCQGNAASLAFDGAAAQAAGVDEFALRSQAFADGQPIPLRHSAYGDDLSPPLAWSAVEGA